MTLLRQDLQKLPRDKHGNILIAENVARTGDFLSITEDNFLKIFGLATALTHSGLSAIATPESGLQPHIDSWKAKGIIE